MSGLHHLALRVADPVAAARFYGELLGLRELQVHREADGSPRSVWLELGAAVLMLERSLGPPGASEGSAHVLVFACEDLEVAAARLAAAGVAMQGRSAFTLYFHDLDGHRVGLSAYRFA